MRLFAVLAAMLLVGMVSCRRIPDKRGGSARTYPTEIRGEPDVRVWVDSTRLKPGFTLSVTGAFDLVVQKHDKTTARGGGEDPVSVRIVPTARGVKVGRDEYAQAEIVPRGKARVLINGTPFPGSVKLSQYSRRTDRGKVPAVRVVVKLRMERYLEGVLPNEMPASWPLAALRAQAVASRSYALYSVKTRKSKAWDLRSSVASQVWKPSTRVPPAVRLAVYSTAGIVLSDNWQLFPAYFHSQCGGRTGNARYIFQVRDMTPLTGVRCANCQGRGETLRWRFSIRKQDVAARLKRRGVAVGKIAGVRLLDARGKKLKVIGRAVSVEVTQQEGKAKTMPMTTFREALGPGKSQMASSWCVLEASTDPDVIVITGRGYGHGVGMCQYGARFLAARSGEDLDYASILARYYTGARLIRVWGSDAPETAR